MYSQLAATKLHSAMPANGATLPIAESEDSQYARGDTDMSKMWLRKAATSCKTKLQPPAAVLLHVKVH
jgi:hypothetical protein